ncbi:MAG: pirin family protein, partial [Armatimonadetes bacterium]|nr:pirin family protein [Armatimonadota bacterium]
HLKRAFGFGETSETDPFLLLDDFRNENPEDYEKGFPWHPHRGIETITYVLAGTVDHGDSMGNKGTIGAGDIQWMTAGRGIIHQEMPHGNEKGQMHGFQLWGNLPSALKMTSPHYQEVKSNEIPEVNDDDGTKVRVVAGTYNGATGPVDGLAAEPVYLDVTIPPGTEKTFKVDTSRNAFAYVFEGAGQFDHASTPTPVPTDGQMSDDRTLVLFDTGDEVKVITRDEGVRFLFVSGKPLREPVAWHGPIVMNTQEELRKAYSDLDRGTFLDG